MGLDISKLDNVKRRGNAIIARCPACADEGNDKKGEHLFINNEGKFGCVVYPGELGRYHRKQIFNLVGLRGENNKQFLIRKAERR